MRAGNGRIAMQVGGGGRRSGDVDTPEGEIANSQSRSGFGTVGLSWTGDKGYFGGSYGYDDTRYGAPVVEDGLVELTPRKHAFSLRGGAQALDGAFDAFRATLALRRYKHEELLAGDVETAFSNDTIEGEVMGSHRAIGRLKGSIGGSVLDRAFDARGAEALSPAIDQRGFAAFVYEEVGWPHVTLQFGGRIDRTSYQPVGEDSRDFTSGSGSFGLLFRPAGADERVTVALSLARAARNPALEELFYFGAHPGNFAFEIGNPDLAPEHALRLRSRPCAGAVRARQARSPTSGTTSATTSSRRRCRKRISKRARTSSPTDSRGGRSSMTREPKARDMSASSRSSSTSAPTACCRASRRTVTWR